MATSFLHNTIVLILVTRYVIASNLVGGASVEKVETFFDILVGWRVLLL